ncbi:MAG TPA: hypothetical protein VGJ84_13695 [Polyangiaceae bacterium]
MDLSPTRYEYSDREQRFEPADHERFDRLEFAVQALRWLRPKRMTVAVYTRTRHLQIDRGRDLRGGDGATWAIVGIPKTASRRHIAHALAELAGVAQVPFVVDILVARAAN